MEQTNTAETLTFQTEVQQLLHLMIHSLYSHKEIFLRELISNASDACDRLRFESLTNGDLLEDDGELEVRIDIDKDARLIRIIDNGIGMSREEVIENLGTIARSGTKSFVRALSGDEAKDVNLIGQFGVGFYSAFMVADRVTVHTRKAGAPHDHGVRWESEGAGQYSVEAEERTVRGTEIILHLREGEDEFLENFRLRSIVQQYSDHISLPIRVQKEDDADEWETINKGLALWTRPKQDITDEEYKTFYTGLTFDQEAPLLHLHNRVEGNLEYISLFFIPSRAPFDLWDRDHPHGIKLYVRRVFIMDDTKYLMPPYLRFVRGVVDSADLPLNVSREFLQHNKEIDKIRSASVKKVLTELQKLAEEDAESYNGFWDEFGRVLKEGVVDDPTNRETIARLLRFASTAAESPEQRVALDQYLSRMPLKQKAIYYMTAETDAAARQSPHLEVFRKNDIEVLLLSDPIDEWVVTHLTEFDGKPLKSVTKGGLDIDADDVATAAAKTDAAAEEFKDVLGRMREILADRVKEIRFSQRLVDSPACLVSDEHDLGANLERILQSTGQQTSQTKPILELNPQHPLVQNLSNVEDRLADWANVLFDQAALSEGAALVEPASYVRRINALLSEQLGNN